MFVSKEKRNYTYHDHSKDWQIFIPLILREYFLPSIFGFFQKTEPAFGLPVLSSLFNEREDTIVFFTQPRGTWNTALQR